MHHKLSPIDDVFPELDQSFFDTQRLRTLYRIRNNFYNEIKKIDKKIEEFEKRGIKLDEA